MRAVALTAAFSLSLSGAATAQDTDCIENAAGRTVCGPAAEAVRARMKAEAEIFDANPRYDPDAGAAPAEVQRARRARASSAYAGFGQAVFLRGGYALAGQNFGPGEVSFGGPVFSGGYRRELTKGAENKLSIEAEGLFAQETSPFVDPLIGSQDVTTTGLSAFVSLRWDQNAAAAFSTFASFGLGPSLYKADLDNDDVSDADSARILAGGFSDDGDFALALGFTSRAGFTVRLADNVMVESAYRFFGATEEGTIAVHAAELGVTYGF